MNTPIRYGKRTYSRTVTTRPTRRDTAQFPCCVGSISAFLWLRPGRSSPVLLVAPFRSFPFLVSLLLSSSLSFFHHCFILFNLLFFFPFSCLLPFVFSRFLSTPTFFRFKTRPFDGDRQTLFLTIFLTLEDRKKGFGGSGARSTV